VPAAPVPAELPVPLGPGLVAAVPQPSTAIPTAIVEALFHLDTRSRAFITT